MADGWKATTEMSQASQNMSVVATSMSVLKGLSKARSLSLAELRVQYLLESFWDLYWLEVPARDDHNGELPFS